MERATAEGEMTGTPKPVDGNTFMEQILALIATAGLSPSQARAVLDRTRKAIDWGEQEAKTMSVH